MEIIHSQIEKIREENRNHRLVIFVGAGVSRNSGACSWWELVKEIAEKIKYSKCNDCKVKSINCTSCKSKVKLCNDDCSLKYNFSNEEFLLIPQLYYESLDKNRTDYYSFIEERFCDVKNPNIIDDIIISLEPTCIITTNYDHLIEDSNNPNASKYSVIKNDKDLLYKNGDRYIIKMHGDIDDIEHIVLKEDDYLQYSQNHTLIETYIKSLLIDKTFLFIGYSLNDNNLKLIMSYIDYFIKKNNVIDRPPHYLALGEINNKVKNRKYWKNKGIELIDLENITDEMVGNVDCNSLTNLTAKRLYTFLSCIKNDKLEHLATNRTKQLETILVQASKTMNAFKFVGYQTILGLCEFEHLDILKTPKLVFRDESEYKLFQEVTSGINGNKIRQLFIKSSIYGAELVTIKKRESYTFQDIIVEDDLSDELFDLSIRNKYKEIIDKLDKKRPSNEKAYYYSLILYTNGLNKILDEVELALNKRTKLTSNYYYERAIFEFNRLSYKNLSFTQDKDFERFNSIVNNAAIMYGDVYTAIKKVSEKKADIQEMNDLLVKHEESYMHKETIIKYGGTLYAELPIIRQIMYDYYLFYKKNFLMLDWFNNVEHMATPYVKAILCTYYPDRYQYKSDSIFGRTEVKQYPISVLDIDIIVKHVKVKNLKKWVDYYKVEQIIVDSEIDISVLFADFCKSMRAYWNIHMPHQFSSFCYLLSLVELDEKQVERVLNSVLELVAPYADGNIQMLNNSISDINTIVNVHYNEKISCFYSLLEVLIDARIIHGVTDGKNAFSKLIKKLTPIADEKIYMKCLKTIDYNTQVNIPLMCVFSPILLKYDRFRWVDYVKENIRQLPMSAVFEFVVSETIAYDYTVKEYYINKLEVLHEDNKKCCGVKTFPDHLTNIVNDLITLLLIGRIRNKQDIDYLTKYAGDNDYVNFIFNPVSFDYSKVDTADYMWCNMFNNEEFRDQLINHKHVFWSEDKEKRIFEGFGDPFEHRVVYKYLIQ